MTSGVYTLPEIRSKLFPVFEQYNVKKAVLFGSYAKGLACFNSDVDILVDSGLKGMAFYGLLEDVVTALDKDVDLIDVRQIRPHSDMAKEISDTGIVIYE